MKHLAKTVWHWSNQYNGHNQFHLGPQKPKDMFKLSRAIEKYIDKQKEYYCLEVCFYNDMSGKIIACDYWEHGNALGHKDKTLCFFDTWE